LRVAYFGTPEFAVPPLDAIAASSHDVVVVVAQPDRPAGRGMKMHQPAVAKRASELGIPLLQPAKIRTEDFLGQIRASGCDIAVVVAYGRILPSPLLAVPPHGFINIHGSILPRWRGAAPIQRAIEAGDRRTGVTIMRVDEELDHGPVIRVATTEIGPHETSTQLARRLSLLGASEIVTALDDIASAVAAETEQDHSAATHASKLSREESHIDWSEPAQSIYDRWRAFQPWPGLDFVVDGELLKIARASGVVPRSIAPGDFETEDSRVLAGTPQGALIIDELQRAGKKPASAADVLRAIRTGR
jgi:methionyl-tRNA formyltransferase